MIALTRRPLWKKKRWAAALALWLCLPTYGLSYLCLMRQWTILASSGAIFWEVRLAGYPLPEFRTFFAPAEWVDRRLRPRYWRGPFMDAAGRPLPKPATSD